MIGSPAISGWPLSKKPAQPLALPLGELSPKVTERAFQALLNGHINLLAHPTKFSVNLPVGKSQNFQAQSGQKRGAFYIICHPLRLIVLGTIHFDNQLCSSAVKVYNEFADDSLLISSPGICGGKETRAFAHGASSPCVTAGRFPIGCCPLVLSYFSLSVGCAASSPKGRAKGCSGYSLKKVTDCVEDHQMGRVIQVEQPTQPVFSPLAVI